MFTDSATGLLRPFLQLLALMLLAQTAAASDAMEPCAWCAAAAAQASRAVVAPGAVCGHFEYNRAELASTRGRQPARDTS